MQLQQRADSGEETFFTAHHLHLSHFVSAKDKNMLKRKHVITTMTVIILLFPRVRRPRTNPNLFSTRQRQGGDYMIHAGNTTATAPIQRINGYY